MADSGRWKAMKAEVEGAGIGATVTSTYRPGSQGSNGADYHSSGDAVDIHGSDLMKIFEWVLANHPNTAEIIYTPAGSRQIKNGQPHLYSPSVAKDHYDHVHWADPAGTPSTGAGGGGGSFGGLTEFASFFGNTSMWARVGVALVAVVLILVAIARLTGGKVDGLKPAKNLIKKVRK